MAVAKLGCIFELIVENEMFLELDFTLIYVDTSLKFYQTPYSPPPYLDPPPLVV
jgi:hypothetical protein